MKTKIERDDIPSTRKYDKAYINAAINVSSLSDHPRAKVGAIIVSGHRIISSGYNSNTRTYPLQIKLDIAEFGNNSGCNGKLHAETDALLSFIRKRNKLTGSCIYTARVLKNGELAMSRPCPRCMALIKKTGIRDIVYTTPDGIARERLASFD